MSAYDSKIAAKLLDLSVNKTNYNQAKNEWIFTGTVIDNGAPIKYCELCGHELRYEYIIVNQLNGRQLAIGSDCVKNYLMIEYSQISIHQLRKSRLLMMVRI